MKDKFLGCLILFIFGAAIVTGAYYLGNSFGKKHGAEMKTAINKSIPKPNRLDNLKEQVTVYSPKDINGKAVIEKEVVNNHKKGITAGIEVLINNLIKNGILPKGTEIIDDVKVEGNIAIINFNSKILDFTGGSSAEAQLLSAIAFTAVDNDERVKYTQILVNGKKIETIGGHFEVTDPYLPNEDMLNN